VVGVVRDTKYMSLQDNHLPFAYMPMTQGGYDGVRGITLIARSSQPRAALAILRRTVAAVGQDLKIPKDPDLQPRLVSDQIDMLIAPQRLAATLLSGFALLALCISAVGIYGTVSYVTSRRTTEIGIRMALGAQSADVLSLILSETAIAVAVGIGLGVAGATLTTRLLTQWLYKVGSFDPFSFGAAIVVVALVSAVAALAPAWRAIRIDPVQAIKTAE
jgi:ABC-type antimicrobial peptide transport system permease subunit